MHGCVDAWMMEKVAAAGDRASQGPQGGRWGGPGGTGGDPGGPRGGRDQPISGVQVNQRARPAAPRASIPPVRPPVALATWPPNLVYPWPDSTTREPLFLVACVWGQPASQLLPRSAQIVRRQKYLNGWMSAFNRIYIASESKQKNDARIAQGKRLTPLDASVSAKLTRLLLLTSRGFDLITRTST
jgi:hypothetical protein